MKDLTKFLSEDSVLRILRLKLLGSLHGPIYPFKRTSSTLDAINQIIETLQDAGYVAGAFDLQELMECDLDIITIAGRSLVAKSNPIISTFTVSANSCHEINRLQVLHKKYHTGSSQYASAESGFESDGPIQVSRMSLGPSGSALLRERKKVAKSDLGLKATPAISSAIPGELGKMQQYFQLAMKKLIRKTLTIWGFFDVLRRRRSLFH